MSGKGNLYRIVSGLAIVAALSALAGLIALLFNIAADRMFTLFFFLLAFGSFNAFLYAWAVSLSGTDNEKGKGRKALGGLVGHFGGSLLILLVYFFFFFTGSLFEVWTALTTYVVAFVAFVVLLSGMD